MDLLLKSLRWSNGDEDVAGDIRIRNGIIEAVGQLRTGKKERLLDFENHFVYPGMINAHDHLEMNLYPRLGKPPYESYVDWASDIYRPQESPLREIEKTSVTDRLLWGGVKNLISGVTTVVHHNPWNSALAKRSFPVRVLKNYAWSHSLAFGRNPERAFPSNPSTPYIIHAAEGIDPLSFAEIRGLHDLGLLKRNTVLIHGVGLSEEDIGLISRVGASLVWCPSSNLFMFNRTMPLPLVMGRARVALGTDSTLTGSPTMLAEIRAACTTQLVSAREVFALVTRHPASIFGLPDPSLLVGSAADLFIAPALHSDYFENLTSLEPEHLVLVSVGGIPGLADAGVATKLGLRGSQVSIHGAPKWIRHDIAGLKKRLKKIAEHQMEANPLWNLIQAHESR